MLTEIIFHTYAFKPQAPSPTKHIVLKKAFNYNDQFIWLSTVVLTSSSRLNNTTLKWNNLNSPFFSGSLLIVIFFDTEH